MSTIERNEIHLENKETMSYINKPGGKKVLVLLHGNMSSSDNFLPLIENISSEYTVYALDLRGFGDSSYMEKIIDISDLAKDINYFSKALNLDKFNLLGWSLGGNVAMRFAIDYPEKVESLLLMASGPISGFPVKKRKFFNLFKTNTYIKTIDEMKAAVQYIEKLKADRKSFFIKSMLKKRLYNKKIPNNDDLQKYANAVIKQRNLAEVNIALSRFNISNRFNGLVNGSNEVNKIKAPVLFIHGDKDKVVSLAQSRENLKAFKDKADLRILKNGDHALMHSHLKELTSIIETFI